MRKFQLVNILITIALLTMALKCNKSDGADSGIYRGRLFTNHQMVTPQGASVFSRTAINAELLPHIDAGITRLNEIATAEPNNYDNLAEPSEYKVYLFPRSPRCENPAFLIETNGGFYDGGEFDKDPRTGFVAICAVGLVTGTSDYSMLVVDDAGVMSQIVRHEGEHILLWHADHPRFLATMYHDATNYHPILGDGVMSNVRTWGGTKPPAPNMRGVTVAVKEMKGKAVCVLLTK